MSALYVVLEFNQASGQPGDQHVTLFDNIAEAHEFAAELLAENRQTGRRETYYVFELVEVEPDPVDDHYATAAAILARDSLPDPGWCAYALHPDHTGPCPLIPPEET